MKPRLIPPGHSFRCARPRAGAALVITLAALVLMTIMVVSLNDLMRIERGAARSHVEKTRAEMLAQRGLANVIARLRQVTANHDRNWISQPGQLVAGSASGAGKELQESIALSSGLPSPSAQNDPSIPSYRKPAELNVSTFEPATADGIQPHLITNATLANENDPNASKAVQMPLRWIYVRQDGAEESAEQPNTSDIANPFVGRYAYWTDDESSKVNYNLAWTRGSNNPNPASHPTKVNLPTLLGPDTAAGEMLAAAIHLYEAAPSPKIQDIPATSAKYRALSRFFFSTPEDARQVEQVSPGVYNALSAAKFSVTHYNHDPDTTFFNEPRFVLTTYKSRAGNRPFLDIGKSDDVDLWDWSQIDTTKLDTTLKKLNSYLSRTDWPIAPGASLQKKYYDGIPDRLTQLSLNIINYVRAKEALPNASSQNIVIPLRGVLPPGGTFSLQVGVDVNSYIGITRAPRITEMGLYIPKRPTVEDGKTYAAKLKVEIFLPKSFGIPSVDLTKLSLFQKFYVDDGGNAQSLQVNPAETAIKVSEASPSQILNAGEWVTVTRDVDITYKNDRPVEESTVLFRLAIALPQGRLDVTPLLDGKTNFAKCKVNAPDVSEAEMPSIEIDDPRVNTHKDDWQPVPKNSFGAKNSISTLGKKPDAGILPEQDVDKAGNITDVSLVIPAPAGTSMVGPSSNPNGVMASAGELGYISTGMQSARRAGTPWRTLHLQPSKQPKDVLPDWAFMDLFTVPADVPPAEEGKPNPRAIFNPHNTATGGRVNMNAKPEPFNLDRIQPLAAVFQSARQDANDLTNLVSYAEAQTIARNVYYRKVAPPSAGRAGGKQYGYQDGYDTPGEVVEMEGVADRGEESEQLVREIANLITSRGNVFSVYTVGQALRQTPAGKLIVTGEQRQQTMIERYVSDDDAGDANGSSVRFRTIYHRNLLP